MRREIRRLPLAPFWPVAVHATQRPAHPPGQSWTCPHCRERGDEIGGADCITTADLAKWAGVSRRTVFRWMTDGGVPIYEADKLAMAIGVHPATIWPEFHDAEAAS